MTPMILRSAFDLGAWPSDLARPAWLDRLDLAFLRGHGLLATRRPSKAVAAAGEAAVEGAKAALAIQVGDFPPSRWTEWRDNRRTLRLTPRCEQK